MRTFKSIRVFIILPFVIILVFSNVLCYVSGEENNIEEELEELRAKPLIFKDGSSISTDEYNEISPKLVDSMEKTYFFYSSDNPLLIDHQSGFDIYMATYNNDIGRFIDLTNLSAVFLTHGNEKYFTVVIDENIVYYTLSDTNAVYEGHLYDTTPIVELIDSVEGNVSGHFWQDGNLILITVNNGDICFYKRTKDAKGTTFFSLFRRYELIKLQCGAGSVIDGNVISPGDKNTYIVHTLFNDAGNYDVVISNVDNPQLQFFRIAFASSTSDDITPFVYTDARLYVSSNRDGTYDIYRWRWSKITLP